MRALVGPVFRAGLLVLLGCHPSHLTCECGAAGGVVSFSADGDWTRATAVRECEVRCAPDDVPG